MEQQKPDNATTRADNLEDSTANNTASQDTSSSGESYPNKANESKGAGSPYGGTQTSDGKAPDGNQQVNTGATDSNADSAALPEGQGDEYDSQSSYGDKGANKEGDSYGGDDARGSAVS